MTTPDKTMPLRRGVTGDCARSVCYCERDGLDAWCVWLRPNDAELERRTAEPHIDGWPLYSGLPRTGAPDKQPPLPQTEWVLHMPAQPYEPAWTSSQSGYDEGQMREYAAAAVAAERERCANLCDVEAAHSGLAHTGRVLSGLAQRIRKG